MKKDSSKKILFEMMNKVGGMPINENIESNKYEITTVREPIIPDAIQVVSQNPEAIEFNDKQSFNEFANQQRYFSASHSHAFYSVEEKQEWSRNGGKYSDPDSEQSELVFETGHEPVQVWDNKNSIGYIIPSESLRKNVNGGLQEETYSDHLDTNYSADGMDDHDETQRSREMAEKYYDMGKAIADFVNGEYLTSDMYQMLSKSAESLRQYALHVASSLGWEDNELPPYNMNYNVGD